MDCRGLYCSIGIANYCCTLLVVRPDLTISEQHMPEISVKINPLSEQIGKACKFYVLLFYFDLFQVLFSEVLLSTITKSIHVNHHQTPSSPTFGHVVHSFRTVLISASQKSDHFHSIPKCFTPAEPPISSPCSFP